VRGDGVPIASPSPARCPSVIPSTSSLAVGRFSIFSLGTATDEFQKALAPPTRGSIPFARGNGEQGPRPGAGGSGARRSAAPTGGGGRPAFKGVLGDPSRGAAGRALTRGDMTSSGRALVRDTPGRRTTPQPIPPTHRSRGLSSYMGPVGPEQPENFGRSCCCSGRRRPIEDETRHDEPHRQTDTGAGALVLFAGTEADSLERLVGETECRALIPAARRREGKRTPLPPRTTPGTVQGRSFFLRPRRTGDPSGSSAGDPHSRGREAPSPPRTHPCCWGSAQKPPTPAGTIRRLRRLWTPIASALDFSPRDKRPHEAPRLRARAQHFPHYCIHRGDGFWGGQLEAMAPARQALISCRGTIRLARPTGRSSSTRSFSCCGRHRGGRAEDF